MSTSAGSKRPDALFLNQGQWQFREAASRGRGRAGRPGLDRRGDFAEPERRWRARPCWSLALGAPSTLFLNDGTGHFRDATADAGLLAEPRGSTTATLADVDGDGALDLYVANYKIRTMLDSLPAEQRSFDRLTRRVGNHYEVLPAFRDNYRLVDHPPLGRISLVQRADPDWFYRGDGRGHFVREAIAP